MMTYLPGDAFHPIPIFEDRDFWAYCAKQELRFQACAACGALRHPPTPVCWNCHSTAVEWRLAPTRAVVFSFTIVHHAADDRIRDSLPYVVIVAEFPDYGPVKLVSNLLADPSMVHIGMIVELIWEPAADGMFLPRFVRVGKGDPEAGAGQW
ncbi:OB-fold domain-containing protein [Sphingobium phenoxybenzoativorans]|uniref:OB-fold domain-containing protein n=1 Tax=Sphingobium phenoxybenzoativorans TaxID=1592790 RepID=A0A975Q2C1_9SPHN|nr:OB-fold domain-containing protein [Sphingobium phenoxybenzoativorans]QUT06850.1 OB-fold domain-containing protein [Sphingobium phenoxybenzoativorans]